MSISLRLAIPPSSTSASAPMPALRGSPKPRSGCNATAVVPVSLQPPLPRALRFDPIARVTWLADKTGVAPRPSSGVWCQPWWRARGDAAVCCASAHIGADTMRWMSVGAASILMLVRGTAIHKSLLVPFVALQAPSSVISWIKGDYGQWTTFLALLLRLLYFIPGESELPLSTMLFVSIAPYQLMNLRGTQDSEILSMAIAIYLALQHFTGAGGVRKALDPGAIVATLSIICITLISLVFLF